MPKIGDIGSNGVPAFEKGYRGKKMCMYCINSGPNRNSRITDLHCNHYDKACRLVCRNCPGIRSPRQNILVNPAQATNQ